MTHAMIIPVELRPARSKVKRLLYENWRSYLVRSSEIYGPVGAP